MKYFEVTRTIEFKFIVGDCKTKKEAEKINHKDYHVLSSKVTKSKAKMITALEVEKHYNG